jgi:hypothetical protein
LLELLRHPRMRLKVWCWICFGRLAGVSFMVENGLAFPDGLCEFCGFP